MMNFNNLENVNVEMVDPVLPPYYYKLQKCRRENITKIHNFVKESRDTVKNIYQGKDKRKLLIVGPCSIHNIESALEFATKLKVFQEKVKDRFFVIMRTYFEKPRTTIGWKGLVYDPDLDNSIKINKGLEICRNLLLDINDMGVPCALEFLDVFTPEYFADLITWGAIGARTTESPLHRHLASGLSCPIGFKNGSNGEIDIGIAALQTVIKKNYFFGINDDGNIIKVETKGNTYCHMVLRGGKEPNYNKESVNKITKQLENNNVYDKVMIDCSHGNSCKNANNQIKVIENVLWQLEETENKDKILGLMIEANLKFGKQNLDEIKEPSKLEYGVSITDECISFDQLNELF